MIVKERAYLAELDKIELGTDKKLVSLEKVTANIAAYLKSKEEPQSGDSLAPRGGSLKRDKMVKSKNPGNPWVFDRPFPLTNGEIRVISKDRHWRKLDMMPPYGEYKVFPQRACLKWFSKQFWLAYEIRGLISFYLNNGTCKPKVWGLLHTRNIILRYLNNGTRKVTDFQRKLLSAIHYFIRKANSNECPH